MTESQSTLENLLVDEDELNEELLYEVLSDYIGIGSESGTIVLQEGFHDLNAKEKITVILLTQQARHHLGKADSNRMTPTEISEESGIKTGTVYPSVRDLEESGIIVSEDGEYYISPANFTRAKQFLGGEDDE